MNKEFDWRAQLANQYSDPAYKQLLSGSKDSQFGSTLITPTNSISPRSTNLNGKINSSQGVNQINNDFIKYEGIKFPYLKKITLPDKLNPEDYLLSADIPSQFQSKGNSSNLSISSSTPSVLNNYSVYSSALNSTSLPNSIYRPPLKNNLNESHQNDLASEKLNGDSIKKESDKREWAKSIGEPDIDDAIAGLIFLEAMMKTFATKSMEMREDLREQGEYLYQLSRPLVLDDINYIKDTLIKNLKSLLDDCKELLDEMTIFQSRKIDDMIILNTQAIYSSNNQLKIKKMNEILSLKEKLSIQSSRLFEESTLTLVSISHSLQYSYGLSNFPPSEMPSQTLVDGIYTNWDTLNRYEKKCLKSIRSFKFIAYMNSRNLPVNSVVFNFLESYNTQNYFLSFNNYNFVPNELTSIFNFFKLLSYYEINSYKKRSTILSSIKFLIFYNCNLNDSDCSAISLILPYLTNLNTLNLSNNLITYSGLASLCTKWYEYKSKINFLNLENNKINSDGASLLAEVISNGNLPYLKKLNISNNLIKNKGFYSILKSILNKKRRIYNQFPKLKNQKVLKEKNNYYNYNYSNNYNDIIESENDSEEEINNEKKKIYSKKCYFHEYFSHSSLVSKANGNTIDAEEQLKKKNATDYNWINQNTDEFDMDYQSDYSTENESEIDLIEEIENDSILQEDKDKMKEWREKAKNLTYSEMLMFFDLQRRQLLKEKQLKDSNIELDETENYPKFVKFLLKIRLKLVAINLFKNISKRGHPSLNALSVSNCGITSQIVPSLLFTLTENNAITSIDISYNPELLNTLESCRLFSKILTPQGSGLVDINLANTGISDSTGGVLPLIKSLSSDNCTIQQINLSYNNLGPTTANFLANISAIYLCDEIQISDQYKRIAPKLNTAEDHINWADWDITEEDLNKFKVTKPLVDKNKPKNNYEANQKEFEYDDIADDTSFIDHDLDNEDEYEYDEDYDNYSGDHRENQSAYSNEFYDDQFSLNEDDSEINDKKSPNTFRKLFNKFF